MRNQEEFADPVLRQEQYYAYTDENEELLGYAQFFPLQGVTRLGLGLRPDLCNQGIGADFVRLLIDAAKEKNPQNEIDLEVVTWNVRAHKVYERAGFLRTDTYERPAKGNVIEVHCMVYDPNPHQN